MAAFGRTYPAALQTMLDGPTLRLALCVQLIRNFDGTTLGFTSFNRDLVVGAVTHKALSSVAASALRQEASSGIDHLEFTGFLQTGVVTETDLRTGVYDNAQAKLFWVDWSDPAAGAVPLVSGWLGPVTLTDGKWTAELHSEAARLAQQGLKLFMPTCWVDEFGNSECGANVATFTDSGAVVLVTDALTLKVAVNQATGYFDFGLIRIAGGSQGAGATVTREIKSHVLSGSDALLTLFQPFPRLPLTSDTAELVAGCDHRFETCRDKFSNAANFRGFPKVPGTDAALEVGRGS